MVYEVTNFCGMINKENCDRAFQYNSRLPDLSIRSLTVFEL